MVMTADHGRVRARDVILFNWPSFALAACVAVAGFIVGVLAPVPVRWVGLVVALGASYGLIASGLGAWLVFNRSGLTTWRWLRDLDPGAPQSIVNVTTGFDDSTSELRRLFPGGEVTPIDLFDSRGPHDASLLRARRSRPPAGGAINTASPPFPIAGGSADLVTLLMAAHEVRDEDLRRRLFEELRRIVSPDGRVVVVEHRRDLANAVAFGPGALHFAAPATWRRSGLETGMELESERGITPFVTVFVFRRAAETP